MVKKIKKLFALAVKRIKAIHRRYWIAATVGIGFGLFAMYLWPQSVTFSYGADTCLGHPFIGSMLAKGESSPFVAKPASVVSVGQVGVASRGVCFENASMPKPGSYTVFVAPSWLPFIGKQVTIKVPDAPLASIKQLTEFVPVSKTLVIGLSETDTIFSYKLKSADKTIECQSQEMSVGCSLEKLGLAQGGTYTLQLDRYYGSEKIATVFKTEIKTLPEVTLVTSSIKAGEVVYTNPQSMTLEFSKAIKFVDIALEQDSDKKQIPVEVSMKDKIVTVTWKDQLARQQLFRLFLTRIVGEDGSTLVSPSSIEFTTSGGPKVARVSVGTYKVPIGATVSITFDQALAPGQDIARLITATGGAQVTGYSGTTVTVSFAGVPRCGGVTIKVADTVMGANGISGGSAWQYSTRTICQSVFSIGSSYKGRSLLAYSFGSGARSVVYTGAIHGSEASTRSLMLRWIDTLEANPGSIPADKRVIIIPTVNPDGFASGTRTNARNVDLNRNFNTSDWQSDITTTSNQPFPGGGGASPLSEPESAALANYIGALRPTLVVSYHSIGGMVFANQAGDSVTLAKKYASLSGYSYPTGGSSGTFEYAISGTADDYYAEKLGVPSILVELGSHSYHQFERNQSAMWAMLR